MHVIKVVDPGGTQYVGEDGNMVNSLSDITTPFSNVEVAASVLAEFTCQLASKHSEDEFMDFNIGLVSYEPEYRYVLTSHPNEGEVGGSTLHHGLNGYGFEDITQVAVNDMFVNELQAVEFTPFLRETLKLATNDTYYIDVKKVKVQ